ncbi:VPLPA-CTERM sorting domain-containing protein [Rhodovulum sp.]|uniref:VPLPA-CTERM sorting domain-containing protein n=1 Tax=Rhodovulum sp. TaxID=34009 RepID=UPI00257A5AAD|nr:VPLPA-CTERM sorting domain-containing protein [Rhodovulum sp.]
MFADGRRGALPRACEGYSTNILKTTAAVTAAAAVAAVVMAGGASAATLYVGNGTCNKVVDVDPDANECFGLSKGNVQQINENSDKFEYTDGTVLTGLFGITNWTEFQKEENFENIQSDAKAGWFDIAENYYQTVAVLLKSGNQWAAYKYDNGLSGWLDFQTANGKGLSNYAVLGTGMMTPVPLPAAGWLLLGGLAALKRRRKTAA